MEYYQSSTESFPQSFFKVILENYIVFFKQPSFFPPWYFKRNLKKLHNFQVGHSTKFSLLLLISCNAISPEPLTLR